MVNLDDSLLYGCFGSFKRIFVFVCGVTLLLCLFYALPDASLHGETFAGKPETGLWNVSTLFDTTLQKIRTAISVTKNSRKQKLVLLWTPYFSKTGDWLPSPEVLKCPVRECTVTSNRSLLSESSAVILHWRSVYVDDLPPCNPVKKPCPKWVLFNKEAPPHTPRHILEKIQDRVDWTATYRRDSDIYAPYGKVVKKTYNFKLPEFDPNRRPVCWLVSNCNTPSKREVFVKELQKHMEVDIYGACGPLKCPRSTSEDCYRWLSARCKFYLSLENSFCKDYVTEKLFNAMSSGMIPVVMGTKNYANLLPPRSYINAYDFSSPKELANYLTIVGNDTKMYESYYWWRRQYEAVDFSYKWLCDLCAKLHSQTNDSSTAKSASNLVSWWFDQSGCVS